MAYYTPTKAQVAKIEELKTQGYSFNKDKSLAAAGVIMDKGDDLWFFGLDESIEHNPEYISIILDKN